MNQIIIRGARQNNLKGIDLDIPRGQLVVITGVSGSGKSSLAFDTIYAEGQRRYVESLSVYARQFLERMARPDVDTIEGLSPAISIEQRALAKNPRSTVGTITEIYDYLRLFFARLGQPHCYRCGRHLVRQTVQEIVAQLVDRPERSRLAVLAPLIDQREGSFDDLFDQLRRDGYTRVRVDGQQRDVGDAIVLDPKQPHTIEVYVDRLVLKPQARSRLAESVELALRLAGGVVKVAISGVASEDQEALDFSDHLACHVCGIDYPDLAPRLFSFNSPHGACPTCGGLGSLMELDEALIVPDSARSLREGAIEPWQQRQSSHYQQILQQVAEAYGFSMVRPYRELAPSTRRLLMHGGEREIDFVLQRGNKRQSYQRRFEGVVPQLERRLKEAQRKQREGDRVDESTLLDELDDVQRYMRSRRCPDCEGARLRLEARHVRVAGRPIHEVAAMSVRDALSFFSQLELSGTRAEIAKKLLAEIDGRLRFLSGVGVDYLTLDRAAATLSGGEGQRVRLATQIGASLVGVLYVLDEPSIGLHARDNERLLTTLRRLKEQGNSVLVVEHDEETIRAADFLVDLGPGAGERGGQVMACGTPAQLTRCGESITGQFLSGARSIAVPDKRRPPSQAQLVLRGASHNNLRDVDVAIPLGRLVCVTGVSGSGKSSLIVDTLLPALRHQLHGAKEQAGAHRGIDGVHQLDKIIAVDQAPIGRTPRSSPATYCGVFALIRDLFAGLPDSRMRGYRPGRFSFNVKGGRCEACHGDGITRIEMHFLPDIFVTCEVCGGRRYSEETLRIKYRGKSIADVLAMSVDEARCFLQAIPRVNERLSTLSEVGLGYIALGQPANTLSGGEAQRIKLGRELSRRSSGRTLYLLDEPTSGLHFADIHVLLQALDRLVEAGNTVLVIEHHLDVVKSADHVIDLGPEGGPGGGRIVGQGTPEQLCDQPASHTGRSLERVLRR